MRKESEIMKARTGKNRPKCLVLQDFTYASLYECGNVQLARSNIGLQIGHNNNKALKLLWRLR